jgi:hypothetical protein
VSYLTSNDVTSITHILFVASLVKDRRTNSIKEFRDLIQSLDLIEGTSHAKDKIKIIVYFVDAGIARNEVDDEEWEMVSKLILLDFTVKDRICVWRDNLQGSAFKLIFRDLMTM